MSVGPAVLLAARALIAGIAFAALGGCAVVGFFGNAIFPEKVKAVYRLADRSTAIVVDDPWNLLDDPALLYEIGHGISVELVSRHVLAQIVPAEKLVQLASRLGDEFDRMPMDRVGKEIGAEQVLHVNIQSVMVGQIRMNLVCQVRVIDVKRSARLFPAIVQRQGKTSPIAAGTITVELIHRPTSEMSPGTRLMANRELARRVSVEVARLFHDHERPKRSDVFGQSAS